VSQISFKASFKPFRNQLINQKERNTAKDLFGTSLHLKYTFRNPIPTSVENLQLPWTET